MNTALLWIKAYVPGLGVTVQDYTDAVTFVGTKVKDYTCLDKSLERIAVGEILEVRGHPDADKLVVCQVNVGVEEPVQIVTGVPNIVEKSIGEGVSVVLDGDHVAGGHDGDALPEEGTRIKQGKLRGAESCGMMCSVEELGASRDMYPDAPENGIYILPGDSVPGSGTVEAIGLRDVVLEYEVTSNHVDCYSVIGTAREAAVTFGKAPHALVVTPTGNGEDIHDYLNARVEGGELCPRYCARMVKDIKLVPSPQWMQHRLAGNGIRPINSIMDITNYVMEEYEQPMHASDYDRLADRKIVVECARDGDVFQTLSGQEKKLDSTILVINDGEKEVGIAGAIGGKNSEITDDVQTMIFGSVCFSGIDIRLSARKVGLRTNASGRYEKGLDSNTAEEVVNRVCQPIEELGTGEAMGDITDLYPGKRASKRVLFNVVKINRLLGTDVPEKTMFSYLKTTELNYDPETKEVIVPAWCQDLEHMADLVEEVTGLYGYDKILTMLPPGEAITGKFSYELQIEGVARRVAEFRGFSQGMTRSFKDPKVFDRMLIPGDNALRKIVEISNLLRENFSVMCITPLNGMLTSLSTNYNRRDRDVRLYRLTSVYHPKSLPFTELPDRRIQFALGIYGGGDFFIMKDVVEEFFEKAEMHKKPHYDPSTEHPYLHPGRKADIPYDDAVVDFLGEVHPDVTDSHKIGDRAYIVVIDVPPIIDFTTFDRKYISIARFSVVTRDISTVVPKDILVGQTEDVVERRGGKVPEGYKLFDVYEGAQVLADHESVTYSITSRVRDHILEEKEVTSVMNKILNELGGLGIKLRA